MRARIVMLLTVIAILSVMAYGVLAQAPGGPGKPEGPPPMPLMEALDANGDGELSAEEIAGAAQALKKLDKNGDGKLSREELRPRFPGPGGPGGPGGGGMGPPGTGRTASFESAPRPKDDAEQKILKVLDEIVQKQGRMLNVPTTDGRLLRLVCESIGAKSVVEIGTSNGISAIWLGLALRKTGGKLITHELNPRTAALARENFATAGVADLVTVVEGDAHETVAKLTGPIDLVFIDADKPGYLDYFKKLLPLVRPGGLVLAHNMSPRMADAEFVKAITTNPDVETLFYTAGAGMSMTLKKR
jgi:predicted O-methyltransferase YrrM